MRAKLTFVKGGGVKLAMHIAVAPVVSLRTLERMLVLRH